MAKKLMYDATDADTLAASDFVGAHLYAGDTKLTKTTVGAKEALDVYVANGLTVDLDGVYNGVSNLDPDNVGMIAHILTSEISPTIKTNLELGLTFNHHFFVPSATGGYLNSNDNMMGQWTFPFPIILNGSTDYIRARIQDNLVGLDQFTIVAHMWKTNGTNAEVIV